MYKIDEQQIRQWWQVFKGDGKLVEVRLLGKSTYSGYFTDIEVLLSSISPLLDERNEQYYGTMQAYFTLNDINADLYSREQRDKFVKKPKSTTTDGDITRRKFVMIDLDPQRSAGISSSNEEYEKAHLKCVDIYRYLISHGFKEPIITTSGNGYHAYLPCDMPNDEPHTELVKRFLQSLSKMFSDDVVEIDEKVFNPARIDKLIGTWAKKGSDSTDRPWRVSRFLKVPSDLTANSDDLFEKIANLLPKEKTSQQNGLNRFYGGNPFNLVEWLNEHGIKYREKSNGGSMMYELEACPWIESHSDRKKWDSALFVDTNGRITFNCTHSHCKDKRWQDVRLFYEPNAYDRKPQYMSVSPMLYMRPQKPKYEIKEELPELGGKWLCMSDIKKIDLSALENVKTGFTELDHAIVGLNMSEVTLLSGSNSSGKSSWLNSLLLNIVQQGTNVALWSGELRPDILKAWIQMVAAGKEHLRPSSYGDGKYYVPQGVGEQIDHWLDGRFFLYNNEYGTKWQQIFHDMQELLKAQVKVFVLDNLFSLDIDLFDGDRNNKQKELILQIKDFAKTNNVHIILVAHPRKSLTFLRKNDISGTSDLTNAVDNVFIVHRVNNDFFRTGAEYFGQSEIMKFQGFGNVIEVCKNRMYGIVDYMVGMHYEIESRRFKNTQDEVVHYGWEETATQQQMQFQQPQPIQPNVAFTQQQDEPPLWDDWTPDKEQTPF